MQLSPEQQKAIEAQKQQCPFCKIARGEIQSKKVYEDDKLLAILDINPAAKGHLLVMPKEHYPIMPLIPSDIFEYVFTMTKHISAALKDALLLFGDTLFIANGYAAGQQSSHFMLHIIPRETPDGLEFFEPKRGIFERTQIDDAYKLLKHNLPIMLKQRYALYPLQKEEQPETPESSSIPEQQREIFPAHPEFTPSHAKSRSAGTYTKESLIALIESNAQLKQLISTYPEHFRQQVDINPLLKKLFEEIDINEIINYFAPTKPEKTKQKYSMEELVDIVNDNPKLKELLLKQTFIFAEKVQQIPELQGMFSSVDVEELERAVLARDIKQEQDVQELLSALPTKKEKEQKKEQQEGADLDLISRLHREMMQKK